jgi:hypothetical protein
MSDDDEMSVEVKPATILGGGGSSTDHEDHADGIVHVPDIFIQKRQQLANQICDLLQQAVEHNDSERRVQISKMQSDLTRPFMGNCGQDTDIKLTVVSRLEQEMETVLLRHRLQERQDIALQSPEKDREIMLNIAKDWSACVDNVSNELPESSWIVEALESLKLDSEMVRALEVSPLNKKQLGLCRRATFQIRKGWSGLSAETISKKIVAHQMQISHSPEQQKEAEVAMHWSIAKTDSARNFLALSDHKLVCLPFRLDL